MTRYAAVYIEEHGRYIHNRAECRAGYRAALRVITGSSALLGVMIPQPGWEFPQGSSCAACQDIILGVPA